MPSSENCDACKGCCYGFKVELLTTGGAPLSSIKQAVEFKIKVTALQKKAVSQAASSGPTTLNLYDASGFPPSGSGYLRESDSCRRFTWTGKSGNQLTGVTGHGDPVEQFATAVFLNREDQPDTSYTGTAKIYAAAGGKNGEKACGKGGEDKPPRVELNVDSVTFTAADQGVREVPAQVSKNEFNSEQTMTVNVEEFSPSGRCGSDDTSLLPGQWRFRHIAVSINSRRAWNGDPASTLPLDLPDESITYIHVNSAREYAEGFYSLFVQAVFPQVDDRNNPGMGFSDYHGLLQYAGVGGPGPGGLREWSNIDAGGSTVYRNDMLFDDQLAPDVVFSELETVLRKTVFTVEDNNESSNVQSNYTQNASSSSVSREEAWNNLSLNLTGQTEPAPFGRIRFESGNWIAEGTFCALTQSTGLTSALDAKLALRRCRINRFTFADICNAGDLLAPFWVQNRMADPALESWTKFKWDAAFSSYANSAATGIVWMPPGPVSPETMASQGVFVPPPTDNQYYSIASRGPNYTPFKHHVEWEFTEDSLLGNPHFYEES